MNKPAWIKMFGAVISSQAAVWGTFHLSRQLEVSFPGIRDNPAYHTMTLFCGAGIAVPAIVLVVAVVDLWSEKHCAKV